MTYCLILFCKPIKIPSLIGKYHLCLHYIFVSPDWENASSSSVAYQDTSSWALPLHSGMFDMTINNSALTRSFSKARSQLSCKIKQSTW